ncbi:MAG TPA: helix-turn-helix domain-containing protein [Kiritimatiellia bacterium]|nr:helix-turn-helix domain-containing protein [Kiritimatiellia bacterium]
METMGQVFKSARERKRISLSAAAARTRIKLQHLEMMERDDFSRMPAPAYARGFIRMYADFLGLESGPLVEEYNRLHQAGTRGKPAAPAAAPEPPARETAPMVADEPEPIVPKPAKPARPPLGPVLLAAALNLLSPANLRRAAIVLGVILVAWLLVSGVTRCVRHVREQAAEQPVLAPRKGAPAVVQEPSDPYLTIPAIPGATP